MEEIALKQRLKPWKREIGEKIWIQVPEEVPRLRKALAQKTQKTIEREVGRKLHVALCPKQNERSHGAHECVPLIRLEAVKLLRVLKGPRELVLGSQICEVSRDEDRVQAEDGDPVEVARAKRF